ncbi:methionine aminopeptidase [Paracoccidioides lutzii Pb01]|uniref:Methionine aminopeptidase n=1 Tax=Paracoccidioides lutzii (strain ATCC MYA-826 / Pb01) TaxID=502779 RepID=C1H9X5_PARBA|nr:methionine aminopeptidase [Paracoccidioides lutzii Pb01]EEH37148.2 methionine aminopeptidase [Paracoccidioides lutzii Pb01]
MGSKTPENHRRGLNESPTRDTTAAVNPTRLAAASGLLHGSPEGEDEDGEDEDDDKIGADLKSNSQARTTPPRVVLASHFHDQRYPVGEIVEYADGHDDLRRNTAEESSPYARTIANPGISMSKLAQEIEDGIRALTNHQGIQTGDALKAVLGFPIGLCLTNIGAHWTPNPGAKKVILQFDDVLKVDFGVHVSGRIVDSAFPVAFNPVSDNLLAAVRSATKTGLKEIGFDSCIAEISEIIQEVMESFKVELNGKTIPVKAVRNISGHNILRYKIHGDKQIHFVKMQIWKKVMYSPSKLSAPRARVISELM